MVQTVQGPGRLSNVSTRGEVLTGNNVMIAGFTIGGSTSKTVAVEGLGPSLVPFGITNVLPNPTITVVRQSDSTVLATNDDWGTAANASQLATMPFAPTNSLESGLLMTLPPGAYTAILQGVGGSTGIGIAAVYEVDHPETPLTNLSTRGYVLTGNNVMIGGFTVVDSPMTVLVEALGPSLAPFGITNALADPTITLVRSSDNAVLATNDDWGTAPNASQIAATNLAPGNTKEPAIMMTLPPGGYTVIVQGVGGGTGIATFAAYAVQ